MKILYHHRILSADGQLVHIRELIQAMRRRGHSVEIAGPEIREMAAEGSSGLVTRLRKSLPRPAYEATEIIYNLIVLARLGRAIKASQPALIYERYNLFLFAGLWASRWFKIPLMLEVNAPLAEERASNGGLWLQRFARWSEARVWRAADTVFTVTNVLAQQIANAGVDQNRIVIVPNGVNLDRFATLPQIDDAKAALGLSGKRVVGFIGFVRDWHGLDTIVEWLGTVAPPDVTLLLVGDGPATASLRQRAAELGVSDRFIATGVLHPDQVPEYLAAFDVALQPAVVCYASPLKVLEYMGAGCAILAPDQPNIRELLEHGRTAYLFQPGALGSSLEHLIEDRKMRDALGRAARLEVKSRELSWDQNARQVEFCAYTVLSGAASALRDPK